jgi:hypothetical protein
MSAFLGAKPTLTNRWTVDPFGVKADIPKLRRGACDGPWARILEEKNRSLFYRRTIQQIKTPGRNRGLFLREALPLLAALSGLFARLLSLLTGLLLAALSGLLFRLLGLLSALIWIILAHSYSNFLGEVLVECHHSNNSL